MQCEKRVARYVAVFIYNSHFNKKKRMNQEAWRAASEAFSYKK